MREGFAGKALSKLSSQNWLLALVLVLTMGAAALAVAGLVDPGTSPDEAPPAVENPLIPGEAADRAEIAAEEETRIQEIVASGGAGIIGHTVTAEVCGAVDAIVAAGGGAGGVWPVSPELLEATRQLAAAESPNRDEYGAYALLLERVEDGSLDAEGLEIVRDYTQALRADLVTCA